MRNVSDKSCRENKNSFLYIVLISPPPRKSCHLGDNLERYGRAEQATDYNIIQDMCFACWITKATFTHSEYVTVIVLPLQQWLRELVSTWRYTYIAYIFAILFRLISCIKGWSFTLK